MEDTPPYLRPFVLDVPDIQRERYTRFDVYPPAEFDTPRPLVVFVHGGPIPADLRPTPRDWPLYSGYGSAAAQHGSVGITVDHRLHDGAGYATAAGDVGAVVEQARTLEGVDGDRVALWFFSGGAPLATEWLVDTPS